MNKKENNGKRENKSVIDIERIKIENLLLLLFSAFTEIYIRFSGTFVKKFMEFWNSLKFY